MEALAEPIRIIIPGMFWDSQVYSGRLYLFGLSGQLWTLSWEELVADLPIPETLRVAGDLALLGNHYLYEPGVRRLLRDPDIVGQLREKVRDLGARAPWQVQLTKAYVGDNPLPFPHNDSAVHYNTLYVGASNGLYSIDASDRKLSKGSSHLSDAPALHIAAGQRTMAQAGGSDGLFATRLAGEPRALNGHAASRDIRVSELSCMTCEWAHSSVIAASYDHSVYIAPFVQSRDGDGGRSTSNMRQFDRIISEADIFEGEAINQRGFTWGAGDKIFRFNDGHVEVTEYTPHAKKRPTFSHRGKIKLEELEAVSSVVSARASAFGSVVESDNALLVLLSAGGSLPLPGEPTNWRVFPRSKNYINQLHVIYEDHLQILAFTHDYFVDQKSKLAGLDAGGLEGRSRTE